MLAAIVADQRDQLRPEIGQPLLADAADLAQRFQARGPHDGQLLQDAIVQDHEGRDAAPRGRLAPPLAQPVEQIAIRPFPRLLVVARPLPLAFLGTKQMDRQLAAQHRPRLLVELQYRTVAVGAAHQALVQQLIDPALHFLLAVLLEEARRC